MVYVLFANAEDGARYFGMPHPHLLHKDFKTKELGLVFEY
jgi:hypothetical protein